MTTETTPEGETVFVAEDEPEIASKGPFYLVYTSDAREERWGFYCSNCETLDNAMDSMGRITCNECGNTRKPEEWDAAHE
jgi:hypothetical protein